MGRTALITIRSPHGRRPKPLKQRTSSEEACHHKELIHVEVFGLLRRIGDSGLCSFLDFACRLRLVRELQCHERFAHVFAFFFSSRRRHTRCLSEWSSDVCSSDLVAIGLVAFSPVMGPSSWHTPLSFVAVLPLLWASLRLGRRVTATIAALLAGFALWGALGGGDRKSVV